MDSSFANLSTEKFRVQMEPYADEIYKKTFPIQEIKHRKNMDDSFSADLDKYMGIDKFLVFETGQWLTVQEKYRTHDALKYLDFTQEYLNAEGTKYESPGEFFYLGAQAYFYAWANKELNGFLHWVLLDVARYKCIIEYHGGLKFIGRKHHNQKHGKASFYSIKIQDLQDAILYCDLPTIKQYRVQQQTIKDWNVSKSQYYIKNRQQTLF